MKPRIAIPACVVLGSMGVLIVQSQPEASPFSPYVSSDGDISLPEGFRETWTHLGTWAVAKKEGESIDTIHDVYTQLGVVEQYQDSGAWPDGAVLVKEIRKAVSAKMTTGHATWVGENDIWFVMVKDSERRFPDNPIWGRGWGWALFEVKDPAKNVATDYKLDCLGCHVPARDDDWIFVRGYPSLQKGQDEKP